MNNHAPATNDLDLRELTPDLYWADTVSSTQNLLVAALEGRGNAPQAIHDIEWGHGTTLAAGEQTAGRGRRDRSWSSKPGESVAISMVLDPEELGLEAQQLSWVTLMAGRALVDWFGDEKVSATLKWPNDVQTPKGHKLAGILASFVPQANKLVLGIGINVKFDDERPVEHAAALADFADQFEVAEAWQVAEKAHPHLLSTITKLAKKLTNSAHDLVVHVQESMATIGQDVKALMPNDEELIGRAVALSESGTLIIEDEQGNRHDISAADIVHLRPRS